MIAMTRQNARPADPALSADENSILAAAYGILLKRSRRGNLVQEPHAAGELIALRLATREREVFTAIFLDTREAVDAAVVAGLAAGGTEPREPADYGFMYQRQLTDPDGNFIEFGWMDPVASEQGPEAYMAQQG